MDTPNKLNVTLKDGTFIQYTNVVMTSSPVFAVGARTFIQFRTQDKWTMTLNMDEVRSIGFCDELD